MWGLWEDTKSKASEHISSSITHLRDSLERLRSNRPSTAMIEMIKVKDCHGTISQIKFISTLSLSGESVMINVWEKQNVPAIEKGLMDVNMGLSPSTAGNSIRVTFPKLTTERMHDLVKMISKQGEDCKIAVRSIRQDANIHIKKAQSDSNISEDEAHRYTTEIQKMVDEGMHAIDSVIKAKSEDIVKV
jgi:ribosome recycling factor